MLPSFFSGSYMSTVYTETAKTTCAMSRTVGARPAAHVPRHVRDLPFLFGADQR